jgi:hypothetical protein
MECVCRCSIIPTQQQLQDIYEENLRQRESSRFFPDSAVRAQFLEDERIALMLQNEEFMSELRRDHEFMSALEMEQVPIKKILAFGQIYFTELLIRKIQTLIYLAILNRVP